MSDPPFTPLSHPWISCQPTVDAYWQKPRGKNLCLRSALLFWHLSRSFELFCPQVHTGKVERTQGIGFYRYWRRHLQPILSKPHFQTLFRELFNHSLSYVPAAGETPWRLQGPLDAASTSSKLLGLLTFPTLESSQCHNPSREVAYGHQLTWIFSPTHYLSRVCLQEAAQLVRSCFWYENRPMHGNLCSLGPGAHPRQRQEHTPCMPYSFPS